MDEILRYEAEQTAENNEITTNTRSEVVETVMYQRALKSAQNAMEKGQPISQHLIRSMHGILLSVGRGAEKSPGQYKLEQNYVVDKTKRKVLFTPISPEKLTDGMESLMKYLQSDGEEILIKTAISHVCLLYTSPSPRDLSTSRMPSSA